MKQEGGKRCKSVDLVNSPLISVITVVFNDADHLEATIQSVLNQNFDDFEYLIIDGGSTDGKTLKLIQSYDDRLDYWCSEPDKGIYDAMQKGIHLARGQYIVMKNAGDFFEPAALSTVSELIVTQQPDVVYGDTYKINLNGRKTVMHSHLDGLKSSNTIDHRNVFIKREWLQRFPFDPKLKLCADYKQTLQLWRSGAKFVHSGKILSSMLPYGKSFSLKTYIEVYHIQKQFFAFPKPQINMAANLFWFVFLKIKRALKA